MITAKEAYSKSVIEEQKRVEKEVPIILAEFESRIKSAISYGRYSVEWNNFSSYLPISIAKACDRLLLSGFVSSWIDQFNVVTIRWK